MRPNVVHFPFAGADYHPVWFEPTSTVKCSAIVPALSAWSSQAAQFSTTPPIGYASPNLLELSVMYQSAQDLGLLSTEQHWLRLNSFDLGGEYRNQIEMLCRRPGPVDLSSLLRDGVPQMAVSLLPYFQHLIIKCGDRGQYCIHLP